MHTGVIYKIRFNSAVVNNILLAEFTALYLAWSQRFVVNSTN